MRAQAFRRLVVAAVTTAALLPAAANGESVAFIDGTEVWVASLDGANRTRLSAGENQWRDVAHSSQGHVVGVKLESGKIAQLSFFTHWGPAGTVAHQGILPNAHVGATLATPLNIDVTPDGGAMVWGYSALQYASPVSNLFTGSYFTATTNVGGLTPLTMSGRNWPSLAGNRLVSVSGRTINVQNPIASAPYSEQSGDYTGWLNMSGVLDNTWDLHTVASSDDGRVLAAHFVQFTGGTVTGGKIGVVGTPGLGLSSTIGPPDCFLPTVGIARSEPSVSADGTRIAWQDDEGVKVAPMPTGNPDPCTFPAPPVVISATGTEPDLGGFVVPVAAGPTTPGTGGTPGTGVNPGTGPTTAGTIIPPPRTGAAAFAVKGLALRVTPSTTGVVTVVVTVPPKRLGRTGTRPVIIGRGRATGVAGRVARISVTPVRALRARIARLRGVRATITVRAGGRTTTRVITLR